MSLLVRTILGPEGEVFLLSCEDHCLEWLETNFAMLTRGRGAEGDFRIGNGRPVKAAGEFEMIVRRSEYGEPMQIVPEGRNFIWQMSAETAERFRAMTRALIDWSGPGHQYLEIADPAVPTMLLSKGEYDETSLRAMSLD